MPVMIAYYRVFIVKGGVSFLFLCLPSFNPISLSFLLFSSYYCFSHTSLILPETFFLSFFLHLFSSHCFLFSLPPSLSFIFFCSYFLPVSHSLSPSFSIFFSFVLLDFVFSFLASVLLSPHVFQLLASTVYFL